MRSQKALKPNKIPSFPEREIGHTPDSPVARPRWEEVSHDQLTCHDGIRLFYENDPDNGIHFNENFTKWDAFTFFFLFLFFL